MTEQTLRVQTYRIALPPPWVRIPLREGTEAAIHEIVESVARTTPAQIPPDQVGPKKRELERAMLKQSTALRDQGGIDLYVPVDTIAGFMVRASFSVSEIRPAGGDRTETAGVFEVLLREPGTTTATTPGEPAHGLPDSTWVVRRRVVPGQDGGDPALLVDYTTPVPGAEHMWLVSSFSTSGSDAEDPEGSAAMLAELFHAIMSTWRWELGRSQE